MSFESQNEGQSKTKKMLKRGPTSLHVDVDLWQEVRVMAVLKNKSVTQYFEEALRQKLDEDSKDVKFPVGHGGMYIPPPPAAQSQQPQSQELQEQNQPNIFNEDNARPFSKGEGEIVLYMPGIKFSTNKNKLIRHVKERLAKFEDDLDGTSLSFLEKLPDGNKTYRNVTELEKDIMKVGNSNEELIKGFKGDYKEFKVSRCIIMTDLIKDRDERSLLNLKAKNEALNTKPKPKSENLVKTSK